MRLERPGLVPHLFTILYTNIHDDPPGWNGNGIITARWIPHKTPSNSLINTSSDSPSCRLAIGDQVCCGWYKMADGRGLASANWRCKYCKDEFEGIPAARFLPCCPFCGKKQADDSCCINCGKKECECSVVALESSSGPGSAKAEIIQDVNLSTGDVTNGHVPPDAVQKQEVMDSSPGVKEMKSDQSEERSESNPTPVQDETNPKDEDQLKRTEAKSIQDEAKPNKQPPDDGKAGHGQSAECDQNLNRIEKTDQMSPIQNEGSKLEQGSGINQPGADNEVNNNCYGSA